MACFDFDYPFRPLRQAIDFAEIEQDFVPLQKWMREVELSGHELGEIQNRLDWLASQDFLLKVLQAVSTSSLSPRKLIAVFIPGF
jgi:hypothetical protein